MNLKAYSALELLSLYNAIEAELKIRSVVRTKNNPVGDYAEYLFCKAFDWQQADNSQKAIDAIDAQGVTYQIKARRRSEDRDNRQLGAIRDLKEGSFDYLAGLVFNPDYTIFKAALIPVKMVVHIRLKFRLSRQALHILVQGLRVFRCSS